MKTSVVVFLVFLVTLPLCLVNTQPVASAETVENSWTTLASMPTARSYMGVAVVNGKIYAIGGDAGADSGTSFTPSILNINEEYNPVTDSWTTRASMPTRRAAFGVAVYNSKIYCIGGYNQSDGKDGKGYYMTSLSINEVYDPATDTWTTKAPIPTSGDFVANTVNGKIYVQPYGTAQGSSYVYDPAADSWATTTPPPYLIRCLASMVIGNEIYFIGTTVGTTSVIAYNTSNDSWRTVERSPASGINSGGAATTGLKSPRRFYIFEKTATHIYDPADNSWTVGAPMPSARVVVGVAVINDTFYVPGGRTEGVNPQIPLLMTSYPSSASEQYTPFLFGTIPDVHINSPENMTYTSSSVSVHFWSNSKPSWMGYSLDGQANISVSGNTHNLSLVELSEGKHRLTVYATNIAKDVTSYATVYFTVDITPPSVIVLSPQNKTYGSTNVQLAFTLNENTSWIGYSLDSHANVTITGNTTLPELTYGAHNLTVYAKDLVGFVGKSKTVYFTVAQEDTLPTPVVVGSLTAAIVTTVVAGYFAIRRRKKGAKTT